MADDSWDQASGLDEQYPQQPAVGTLVNEQRERDTQASPRCDPEGPKEIRRHVNQAVEQATDDQGSVLADGSLQFLLDPASVDPLLREGWR